MEAQAQVDGLDGDERDVLVIDAGDRPADNDGPLTLHPVSVILTDGSGRMTGPSRAVRPCANSI
jgi:hypothetical protein